MSITEERVEFDFVDAHGVEIRCYEWRAADAVGVVQISHGIGEHALRYDAFARHLAAIGFTVVADDHRGHGETGRRQHDGDLSRLGRLGTGGLLAAEAGVRQLAGIARERHPGLPLVVFAHSWGSLMTQRIMNEHPRTWDAVVLSGSAFRTFRHMESGNLNARWDAPEANGFEWLSRDPAVSEAFANDPLCFEADILRLFGVADGLRLFGKPGAGLAPEVPILIVSGSDDPLSRGDGVRLLAEAYRAKGVRDVTVKLYPGARHEILQETNRDEVFADVATWIQERVASD
ncbi:alpha/beta fold hydrolase [Leucobacter chromiiresistens]|uniref:Lysophospholipase n=1 Tax=Leucobacter chromiiresistens TaxID=1079994 RepID=A0A147EMA0_9MICO|nr:alpha/beta hydrolase [Leucobacter chromiiresistens]KTR85579.1 lysophospholipase [Leucobacter chromiiresistens]